MFVNGNPRILLLATLLLVSRATTNAFGQSEAPAFKSSPIGLTYRVEPAPAWTALFHRHSGWFGADGIFSIPLDGRDQLAAHGSEATTAIESTTLLLFSDTFIGEVGADNAPLPGHMMVNNSVAYLTGRQPDVRKLSFEVKQGADGTARSFFVPNNDNARPGEFFWLGDGFVNRALDDTVYLFAYHVSKTGPNVFDFSESNVSIIALPKGSRPPFQDHRQIATRLHVQSDTLGRGSFGCAVWENTRWAGTLQPDGHIYVYGCIGASKCLVVARIPASRFEEFEAWRFWNGTNWSHDVNDVSAITDAVSNEMSVTQLTDGRFLLVFQVMGLSDKIGTRIGHSPMGPFSAIEEIYTTPESQQGLLTYNAKAHPALSQPGELMISYNTITLDFWNDIQRNAHIYRPRFIRLTFDRADD